MTILYNHLINKSYVALSSEFFFHIKANNFYQESKEKVFSDIFEEFNVAINGFSENIYKLGGHVPNILWESPTDNFIKVSVGIKKLYNLSKISDNDLVSLSLKDMIDVMTNDSNICVKIIENLLQYNSDKSYEHFIHFRLKSHQTYQKNLKSLI
jgi:hypothetical protein